MQTFSTRFAPLTKSLTKILINNVRDRNTKYRKISLIQGTVSQKKCKIGEIVLFATNRKVS